MPDARCYHRVHHGVRLRPQPDDPVGIIRDPARDVDDRRQRDRAPGMISVLPRWMVRRVLAREWLLFLVCVGTSAALLPFILAVPRLISPESAPSPLAAIMQDVMADREFQRLEPMSRVEVFKRVAMSRDPSFERLGWATQITMTGDALRWHHERGRLAVLKESYLGAYSGGHLYWLMFGPWLAIQVERSGTWAWQTWRRPANAN